MITFPFDADSTQRRDTLEIPSKTARTLLSACVLAATISHAFGENMLEETVVTSSRVPTVLRDIGTSVSILTSEEIEQRGFLNLADIMRTQPGVAASNNGGAGKATSVRVRGEEGFRTMVILDGIDMSDTSGTQVGPRMEHLLSAGIERVEILRGPQGLSYGADAGGIINIQTTAPSDGFGGRITAEAGRYGTQQLGGSIGGSSEQADFLVSVADMESDGFNARDTDIDLRDADGYENTTVHARAGWQASDNLRLSAVVRRVDGDNEFDGCFTSSFSSTNDCTDEFSQDSWRVAANATTGAFSHQLAYSDTQIDRESFSEGVSSFATEGALERLSYVGSWQGGNALRLIYGADHETESIDDGSTDRDRDQLGFFAEYQGRIMELLSLSAGVRHDDNDDFGQFTSYRLSGAYVTTVAGGDFKLKASYGTGFRAPSLFEISYNTGPFAFPPATSAPLSEETSAGFDIGFTWATDDGSYVELNWFDQEVDDLISFDMVGFSGYIQDRGKSTSEGVELTGRLPVTDSITLSGNYTWNDTETPSGEQRLRRPKHLANLSLTFLGMDDRLRVGASLRSSQDSVDIGQVPLDDYTVVDLNASYRVTSGLNLYLRAENVFDEEYKEVITYNTAGAAIYGGVRYEF